MMSYDLKFGHGRRDIGGAVERDIDLDRVVWDPDYRRSVVDRLNRRDRMTKYPGRDKSPGTEKMRMTA